MLNSYATFADKSQGRLYAEPESEIRNSFQRDRDRVIHSTAFRRLEYKTQVFVNHEGDHYRTRLTHSLEVAQVARVISRTLGICEDLAETVALAHDLGHPPFGHAGEDALNEVMERYGGFDHNAQCLKIITKLENKYINFLGLNLTWETIEGIIKHNGPIHSPNEFIANYDKIHNLKLSEYSSLEAQVAAQADDITYNNHDIEDGVRSGLLTIEQLRNIDIIDKIYRGIYQIDNVSDSKLIYEINRQLINMMIMDLIKQTRENLRQYNISTSDDIRHLNKPLVSFSPAMEKICSEIKSFLRINMYKHPNVVSMTDRGKHVVKELFLAYFNDLNKLPMEWKEKAASNKDLLNLAEIISDFIAGMTDRFAIKQYQLLFNIDPFKL